MFFLKIAPINNEHLFVVDTPPKSVRFRGRGLVALVLEVPPLLGVPSTVLYFSVHDEMPTTEPPKSNKSFVCVVLKQKMVAEAASHASAEVLQVKMARRNDRARFVVSWGASLAVTASLPRKRAAITASQDASRPQTHHTRSKPRTLTEAKYGTVYARKLNLYGK